MSVIIEFCYHLRSTIPYNVSIVYTSNYQTELMEERHSVTSKLRRLRYGMSKSWLKWAHVFQPSVE